MNVLVCPLRQADLLRIENAEENRDQHCRDDLPKQREAHEVDEQIACQGWHELVAACEVEVAGHQLAIVFADAHLPRLLEVATKRILLA